MKAWNLVQTPWKNDTMPSQGADYSWPGDNFKIAFPGQPSLLMRVTGSTFNYVNLGITYTPVRREFAAIF